MRKPGPSKVIKVGGDPCLRLPEKWIEWLRDSMAAGADDATVTTALAQNGFATELVQNEIHRARNDRNEVVAAKREVEALKKLESLLAARCRLAQLDPRASVIERRRRP